MRRAGLAFVLTILSGSMALAQQVTVQSGDHDGFTRLVAAIGAGRDWATTRSDRELRIAFSPDSPTFDLSRVFDLISRDRLRSIENDNGLVLVLACDCTVEITRYQDRYAVIDISDDPYLPPAPPPPSLAELPLFTGRVSAPALPAVPLPDPAAIAEPTPLPTPPFAIEDAGSLLAEQLARAAAAGLLDPAPNQPLSTADPVAASPDPVARDQSVPVIPETEPPSAPPPILAANAYDLNIAETPGRLVVSTATTCIAAPVRPIGAWTGDFSFLNGLGRLRARVFDDRGTLDAANALELAELYLVHGFGAEAAFWLGEMASPPAFHTALAHFLDHRAEGVFGAFEDHDLCQPQLLLWLFLSDPEARPLEEVTVAILAQYFALPVSLRDALGPDLARAFVRAGREGAALEVREALARGGRLSPRDLAFLDLELPGVPPPSQVEIDPANAGTQQVEPALTHRLMTQIRRTGVANPEDLVAADALVLETRPALRQGGLRHAAALGHALVGDIEGTLSHLALNGQRDADAAIPVFADIVDALMDLESTAPLLLLLSSENFGQFGHFPNPSFRRQVADFLLDHGLPGMARDLVLAGGSDHARDRALLERVFDRLAEDRAISPPAAAPATDPVPDAPPAQTREDMAALLSESRALRAELSGLLSGGSTSVPDS